jgi:hypothetical protein
MNEFCLNILIPGLGKRWQCGGLWSLISTASLDLTIKTRIVTYIDREEGYLFLNDLNIKDSDFFLIGWGPHITYLSKKIPENRIIINSHSFLSSARPPESAPIICSSRYTLSNWARYQSARPLYLIPGIIDDHFINKGHDRPIDILIFERKISPYLKKLLLPKLENVSNVFLVTNHIEDLSELYNKSKILLYDSRWHFSSYNTEEGFGLHPLEARACGCNVFTSFNGALSQYFEIPGFHQIHINDSQYDMDTILKVLKTPTPENIDISAYRKENIRKLWNATIESCITFLISTQSNKQELLLLKKMNFNALLQRYLQRALKRFGQL